MGHIRGAILAALACLTLSGCQGQLYGSLSEAEANSILAALLEAAIPAEKRRARRGPTPFSSRRRNSPGR